MFKLDRNQRAVRDPYQTPPKILQKLGHLDPRLVSIVHTLGLVTLRNCSLVMPVVGAERGHESTTSHPGEGNLFAFLACSVVSCWMSHPR
jgi:hypothetical protein